MSKITFDFYIDSEESYCWPQSIHSVSVALFFFSGLCCLNTTRVIVKY